MNNRILHNLVLLLVVCLPPSVFAAVTVNGTQFDSFKLLADSTGDVTLKTVPVAATGTIPLLTKAVYDIDLASDMAGDTTITTVPAFTPVNCTATPDDVACSQEPPPPPPGTCGDVGAELVFETLNWAKQPGTIRVSIGKKDKASKFITTTSQLYAGAVAVVPTTAMGYVGRRVWISECPGADPLNQTYRKTTYVNGVKTTITAYKCDVKGSQLQLNWTQESAPSSITACKLEPNKEYYLNYSNTGTCNSTDCPLYRSTGHNGKN